MLKNAASGLLRHSKQAVRSAQQQRFAETQAATQSIDWDALQELVSSDEGRRELSALRTTYAEVQNKAGAEEKAIKIDWDKYKDVEPETVALFRKTFESLKFPNYDPSNDIKEARASFEPIIKQAQELAAHSEQRLKDIDQELKQIQHEKERISELTIDEELAAHPDVAKEIDEEISQGNFLP